MQGVSGHDIMLTPGCALFRNQADPAFFLLWPPNYIVFDPRKISYPLSFLHAAKEKIDHPMSQISL